MFTQSTLITCSRLSRGSTKNKMLHSTTNCITCLELVRKLSEECVKFVKLEGKDCVISISETSLYLCAIVNERLGYSSPSLQSISVCRNKYHTRKLVTDFEWCYGFNLGDPVEQVVKHVKSFPCMLKPTSLCAGKGAFRCDDEASLRFKLQIISDDKDSLENIQSVQSQLLPLSVENDSDSGENPDYMVEEFIETWGTGIYQYFMEVFVTKEGKVIPYTLAEVFVFQGGMFLGTVIPPIHANGGIKPFEDHAIHIGGKLYNVGFKNQGFSLEFWRFPNCMFRLIEINPRVSPTTFDLHEQYSGSNIFNDVTDLMVHNKEPKYTPMSALKKQMTVTDTDDYTFLIDFSSRATGLVSSVFNYDLLEDLSAKGHVVLFLTDRDVVLTEANATTLGKAIAFVTIKGTWNEIVNEEKSLRQKLYMGLPQYSECFKYPNYFTLK